MAYMLEEGQSSYFIVVESEDGERRNIVDFLRDSFDKVVGQSYFLTTTKMKWELGDKVVAEI